MTQYRIAKDSEYARLVSLGVSEKCATKRSLKFAKRLHPASIAAQARRANLAVAHNKAHAALDGATWAQLNGVQL